VARLLTRKSASDLVVLQRLFSNSSSTPLTRAIRAYRRVDLSLAPHGRPTGAPKRAKWLNGTELARLVDRYSSGATVYELATEFSVDRKTISRHLKAAGIRMGLRPLTTAQVEEAIRLYTSGLSLAAVGRELGVHASTVNLALRKREMTLRNPWDHPRQRGTGRSASK